MRNQRGFTLVELLLYSVLIGLVVMSTAILLNVLQRQRVRSQVIAEVEGQGLAVMQVMTQVIRNATAVNAPAIGSSSNSVSVNVTSSALSPTVFSLSSGAIVMVEGANPGVGLTSGKITISGLTFSNYGASGTAGSIRIQFDVSYNNPGGQAEYTYSRTFIGSASIR